MLFSDTSVIYTSTYSTSSPISTDSMPREPGPSLTTAVPGPLSAGMSLTTEQVPGTLLHTLHCLWAQ